MPKHITRTGVQVGFQRAQTPDGPGMVLVVHDELLQETELIGISDELRENLLAELTGVHVAHAMPPELARKMGQERGR